MPQIKTLNAESVYKADHGGEKFLVTAESNGVKFNAHTWSPTIAKIGFEGEVEKYRDKGGDDCLRLPKKDDWQPQNNKQYSKRDDLDIRAQMAVKTAASLYQGAGEIDIEKVKQTAKELFKMVDEVKGVETARQILGGQEIPIDDLPTTEEVDNTINLADIPF